MPSSLSWASIIAGKSRTLKDFFYFDKVERVLREWMTFESLRMILGDDYVKGMLEELGKSWEDYDTTAGEALGFL